jgi:hypothetical protein
MDERIRMDSTAIVSIQIFNVVHVFMMNLNPKAI